MTETQINAVAATDEAVLAAVQTASGAGFTLQLADNGGAMIFPDRGHAIDAAKYYADKGRGVLVTDPAGRILFVHAADEVSDQAPIEGPADEGASHVTADQITEAAKADARWTLTGFGYDWDQAAELVDRMVAEGVDIDSTKAMRAWLIANA